MKLLLGVAPPDTKLTETDPAPPLLADLYARATSPSEVSVAITSELVKTPVAAPSIAYAATCDPLAVVVTLGLLVCVVVLLPVAAAPVCDDFAPVHTSVKTTQSLNVVPPELVSVPVIVMVILVWAFALKALNTQA
jgi:hypothetical protein